ncbi:DNA ligase 1-like [Capsicum annuum]|uniref:DNA ligase 1-like n=1 Tax=Capsicum annuum TaxID=4072 RepID=UPI0007BF3859|nr:DNA ligase 1-like [Capsicum annuum]
MGKKIIHTKGKAGSSRKTKAEAAENVSKRNKIDEKVSESDPDLKEVSDYAESNEDVLPERSVSRDSEESKESGRNSDDGDNDPLSVSLLRFIFVEWYELRTIMDEVGSFPTKISVRSRMAAYQEFKQVLVDQELKKRFKWSCFGHLRNLSKHLKFNGQLVHYLLLRCVKRDKMRHGMWFCINNKPDHYKLVAALEEAMLDIAAYIREKRLKKKNRMSDNTRELKKKQQQLKKRERKKEKEAKEKEEAEKIGATADEEEEEEEKEEANKEEVDKDAAAEEEKEGQKEAIVEGEGKKEGEKEKQDGFMDIVDEINNTYADEEEIF